RCSFCAVLLSTSHISRNLSSKLLNHSLVSRSRYFPSLHHEPQRLLSFITNHHRKSLKRHTVLHEHEHCSARHSSELNRPISDSYSVVHTDYKTVTLPTRLTSANPHLTNRINWPISDQISDA